MKTDKQKIVQTGYEGNDTHYFTLCGIQIGNDGHPYKCTHLPMRGSQMKS